MAVAERSPVILGPRHSNPHGADAPPCVPSSAVSSLRHSKPFTLADITSLSVTHRSPYLSSTPPGGRRHRPGREAGGVHAVLCPVAALRRAEGGAGALESKTESSGRLERKNLCVAMDYCWVRSLPPQPALRSSQHCGLAPQPDEAGVGSGFSMSRLLRAHSHGGHTGAATGRHLPGPVDRVAAFH